MSLMEDVYPSRQKELPDWTPRCEPVVYSKARFNGPLSGHQCESYARDGFLVVSDLFSDDEIDLLCDEQARMYDSENDLLAESLIREPDSREVRSIFAVHSQSAMFARLAADQRLAAIAMQILDDDVYVHQSRLNYKPGFEGKDFYWHSDFETWHVEDGMPRMRALSMSLLLSENTAVNGPLMLIPGSHNFFVSCVGRTPEEHYRQSLRRQEYGVPDSESLTRLVERGGINAPTGAPGTLIIFDCNTMHGSNGNITPFSRTNAFIVYNALSNALIEPFGGGAPRPEFVASRKKIERIMPLKGKLGSCGVAA